MSERNIKIEECDADEDAVWGTDDGWVHQVIERTGSDSFILCVCDDADVAKRIRDALLKA